MKKQGEKHWRNTRKTTMVHHDFPNENTAWWLTYPSEK
jgi:hypothetical protein